MMSTGSTRSTAGGAATRRVLTVLAAVLALGGFGIGPASADTGAGEEPSRQLFGLESEFAYFFNCAVRSAAPEGEVVEAPEDFTQWQQQCADLFDRLGDDDPGNDAGFNVGGRSLLTDELYASAEFDGDVLGHALVECTVHSVDFDQCHGTLHLGDGQVTFRGAVDYRAGIPGAGGAEPYAVAAVTGGTGAYFGASGELRVTDLTEYPDAGAVAPAPVVTRYDLYLER